MSRSSSNTGRTGRSAARAAQPRGTRVPQPDLLLYGLRASVLLCLLLLLGAGPLARWAETRTQGSGRMTDGWQVVANVARSIEEQPLVFWPLWGISSAGLLAMTTELLIVTLVLRPMQHAAMRRCWQDVLVLGIRSPQVAAKNGARPLADPHADLFRAMYQALPTSGRLRGRAPWAAFTLLGQPDQPVELGLVIGGQTRDARTRIAAALTNALVGLCPEVQVDPQADPLGREVQPGRVVAWREFRLKRSTHYPIRLLDDVAGGALIGPVLAALRPRGGTLAVELQIIVRPASNDRGWTLHQGWRGRAMALKLKLEGKADYALSADVKALEAKLAGAPYEVTLRATAVAAGKQAAPRAEAALDAVTDALGEYQARTSGRLQRFVVLGGGVEHVHAQWPRVRRSVPWAIGAIGAALAIVGSGAPGLLDGMERWPLLAVSPTFPVVTEALWTLLIAVGASLVVLAAGHRQRGVWQAERLRTVVARAPGFAPPSPGLLPLRPWPQPMILSSIELGGLWHLPTPTLGTLVRWLPCRQLPAPPHAYVLEDRNRIVIGHARRDDGTYAPVGPTLADMREITHLTAGMGAGKTRALANMCQQFLPYGLTLIDGKGDDQGNLVATVRQLIPLADEARLVIVDVLDAQWPLGLNPLADVDRDRPGAVDQLLGQIQAIFARLDPETWSRAPGMQDFLTNGTLLVVEGEEHATLANIKQALLDETYRAQLLPRVRNQEVRTFWEVTYPEQGEGQRASLHALMRRFNRLLTPELTRYMVTQAVPTLRFGEAIEQRLIVLIPIPHVTLGDLAGAVSMVLFQSFLRAAFARPGSAQTRANYPLVVDEVQVMVENSDTRDMEHAVTQLRALGIPAVYAHQALTQLGKGGLKDLMLVNAGNRIMLQTLEPDATTYARQYAASGLTATDISAQAPLEHQYAVMRCNGQPAGPLSLRPLPWPQPVAVDVPAYLGPPWQTIVPPDSPDPQFDRAVLDLVYGEHTDATAIAEAIAQSYGHGEYAHLLSRWEAIRIVQRQYILDHPGCIEDRLERQRWLSRLLAAQPRVLAEVEYLRQRPVIVPASRTSTQRGARATGGGNVSAAAPDGSRVAPPPNGEPADRQSWATPATPPELPPTLPDPRTPPPDQRFFE